MHSILKTMPYIWYNTTYTLIFYSLEKTCFTITTFIFLHSFCTGKKIPEPFMGGIR